MATIGSEGGMSDKPSEAEIAKGLAFIDELDPTERLAFLGLFAGARYPWRTYDNGEAPFIGKAECEWVEDWRDFYLKRLTDAGLFEWSEGESGPALGMVRKENGDYHTWTVIDCRPSDLGYWVREAWRDRFNNKLVADK